MINSENESLAPRICSVIDPSLDQKYWFEFDPLSGITQVKPDEIQAGDWFVVFARYPDFEDSDKKAQAEFLAAKKHAEQRGAVLFLYSASMESENESSRSKEKSTGSRWIYTNGFREALSLFSQEIEQEIRWRSNGLAATGRLTVSTRRALLHARDAAQSVALTSTGDGSNDLPISPTHLFLGMISKPNGKIRERLHDHLDSALGAARTLGWDLKSLQTHSPQPSEPRRYPELDSSSHAILAQAETSRARANQSASGEHEWLDEEFVADALLDHTSDDAWSKLLLQIQNDDFPKQAPTTKVKPEVTTGLSGRARAVVDTDRVDIARRVDDDLGFRGHAESIAS
jgi:hypothetical protein